jgi:hypothetical protein
MVTLTLSALELQDSGASRLREFALEVYRVSPKAKLMEKLLTINYTY